MENEWINNFYELSQKELDKGTLTVFDSGDGYSFIGEYSPKYKQQMGLNADDEVVPFFKFYFDKEKFSADNKYIPLTIDVSITSVAREGDRIRYMLNDSRIKRLRPIDFVSKDDFFVNTDSGQVYRRIGNRYKLEDLGALYDRILRVHSSNILTVMGLYRRMKLFSLRRLPSKMLGYVSWSLGFIYWVLKGKLNTYDVMAESFRNRKEDQDQILESAAPVNAIDFFGYKVSVWTLYSYSLCVILFYIFAGQSVSQILPTEGSFSSITVIAFAIVSIVTYDKLLPTAVDHGVKKTARISFYIKYRGIKLKV
jgi:hypothetical protein